MTALTGAAACRMIRFYQGSRGDIAHFLKVWALAAAIGSQEGLDPRQQETLELAAIVHDIACPLCRQKYGRADGFHQEQESPALLADFFAGLPLDEEMRRRIDWLVSHHHSYGAVDGLDHRILLEADFLVNAGEHDYSPAVIASFRQRVFRTTAGRQLLDDMYRSAAPR